MLPAAWLRAQTVPQPILDKLIKTYTDKGYKLEKSVLPDFTRPHPNKASYFYTQCYPGRGVVVVAIMGKKPSDWKLKVGYGSQSAVKSHTIGPINEGSSYYTDYIITSFPEGVPNSDYCMNVVAYDGDAIDLPVYLYIFSFTPK